MGEQPPADAAIGMTHVITRRHYDALMADMGNDDHDHVPEINEQMILARPADEHAITSARHLIGMDAKERKRMIRTRSLSITPVWVADYQNDIMDRDYLDETAFGDVISKHWIPNTGSIHVDDMKEYIDSIRIQPACHEGTYIAQPYDSKSSATIPVYDEHGYHRAGALDRKLRVITEHTGDIDAWHTLLIRALHNIYAYDANMEYVMSTRLNMIRDIEDWHKAVLGPPIPFGIMNTVLDILSWNIFRQPSEHGTHVPVVRSWDDNIDEIACNMILPIYKGTMKA